MYSKSGSDQLNKKKSRQSLWGKFFQILITWTVYFLFRPKILYANKNLKKDLKGKPCVFVANHTHHFDGAYGGAVLWRYKPWVLVTKKWFEKKRTGKMISWCRCISISLDEADGKWFEECEEIISENGSLLIFPEGALSKNGKINEFKPGAGLISAKTGAMIVPCAIYGTYEPVFGMRQKILIGEPIESKCPENMRRGKYARELMTKAQAAVEANYAELENKFGKIGQYAEK